MIDMRPRKNHEYFVSRFASYKKRRIKCKYRHFLKIKEIQ